MKTLLTIIFISLFATGFSQGYNYAGSSLNNTTYIRNSLVVGNIFVMPNDTLSGAPNGAAAIKNYVLYIKNAAGTWSQVSGVGGGSSQWITSGSNLYYNSGNVGIGFSVPAVKLHVNGAIASNDHISAIKPGSNTVAVGPFFQLADDPATPTKEFVMQLNAAGGTDLWAFRNGTWRQVLTIDTTGYLGAGLRNPLAMIHLKKDQAGPTDLIVENASSNTAAQASVRFIGNSSGVSLVGRGSSAFSHGAINGNATYLYTTQGDVVLMSDDTSGTIKFAPGGSSAKIIVKANGVGEYTTNPNGALLPLSIPTKKYVDSVKLRVGTTASSATPTPSADNNDQFNVTALATAATFAAPTGTPTDGQSLRVRIKDNGTARTLAWDAIYRAPTDFALPSTTVVSKTMYVYFIYNAADSRWDAVSLTNGL